MVTEKEIDGILKFPAWRKITTSKIPTWVMKDGLEGVEIFEGKIRTFWMKKDSPDRIYGEPASEGVSQIYQAFNEQKAVEKQAGSETKETHMKRCLCGAVIADKYIMCVACNNKLKERSVCTPADKDSKLLEVLNHMNWNLGIIAKSLEAKK